MGPPSLPAVLDRLLALEGGTGAELGVAEYVAGRVPGYPELLERLAGFEQLEPGQQDEALRTLDAAGDATFGALVAAAHEAYYAHPASWGELGYTTNLPEWP